MADGSDTPQSFTGKELKLKRHTAAAKLVLSLLQKDLRNQKDHPLYSINLGRDLTDDERVTLTWVLLDTFPADQMEEIVRTWFENKGMPGVSLMDDPRADAKFWASDANGRELSAYAAASFNQMSPKAKAAFRSWVNGKGEA